MLMESKYTSPAPVRVAHALAEKPKASPSAIGVSSPMRRWRSSWRAPEKNGPQAKSSTGVVMSRLAQRMSASASGVSSPAPM